METSSVLKMKEKNEWVIIEREKLVEVVMASLPLQEPDSLCFDMTFVPLCLEKVKFPYFRFEEHTQLYRNTADTQWTITL